MVNVCVWIMFRLDLWCPSNHVGIVEAGVGHQKLRKDVDRC